MVRMARKYKDVVYKGIRVEFVVRNGLVLARAPAITRQFIGSGTTKTTAFNDAKREINKYLRKRR